MMYSGMSRDECRKYLRFLELDAYARMVSALRAQGPLTEGKQKLLGDLASALHIPNERHQAEIRRAVNDDKLSSIAEQLFGPNTDTEWTVEGRRIIPLFPRLKGRTAYTTFANSLSLTTAIANDRHKSFPAKREGRCKGSQLGSKFEENTLSDESDVNAMSRKRKRSHDIASFNNGIYGNHPSTSTNQITLKNLNSTKAHLLSSANTEQCPTNRQRIGND
ncbi:hypothetical protein QAD02_023170 [Eretmocerus hayati]|uniref:Uncharacterized protein n=1 Tax=Eretmocerus hayati TaxID=131215 RepID=A0ACC2PWQ8_9HYME|nr:hypothetical protein QAD02_023170 [Eretmocerus hayati]